MEVKVTGVEEACRALASFGDILLTKYARKAAFAGATVFKEQAVRNAPILKEVNAARIPGALRDAIAVFKRPTDGAKITYVVGVRKIKIKAAQLKRLRRILHRAGKTLNIQGDVFYAHLTEFGFHDRAGHYHAGTRWMTRAFEDKKLDAVDAMSLELSKGVVAAVATAKSGT